MSITHTYRAVVGFAAIALITAACSQDQDAGAPAGTSATSMPAKSEQAPVAAGRSATSRGHSGIIQGVVTDASGQPAAGAFVRLQTTDGRLTFMVISQDGGDYTADRLPPGEFTLQAIGGDYQSSVSQPVNLARGESAPPVNLALAEERTPDLPYAWPRRVPEDQISMDAMPEGAGKAIIATKCSGCHSVNQVLASRYEPEAWKSTIEEMRGMIEGSGQPEMSAQEAKVLLDYLVANLAPLPAPDPNSRFPRELLQGEARNYRVVQYNLENRTAEAHDVAVDPWGVGWANQRTGGMVSRFDPITYEYREVGPPLYTSHRARPGNLQISRDGIMWLADPFETRWLSYDIAEDKWTDWPFPKDRIRGQVQGNSIVLHQDGTVWMSGHGAARRLDPSTGEWSAWDTPTWNRTHKNPGGYGITSDGNGRVWLAMNLVDRLARFDAETGEVVEFQLEPGAYPRRMDHDPHGDVWIGLWGVGKVLKINHRTNGMTTILPPLANASGSGAYSIDFDQTNDLLWVTLQTADIIARYNPDTEDWLMLPMAQAETDVRRIEVDQNNINRVWFSSTSTGDQARIGYLELLEDGASRPYAME